MPGPPAKDEPGEGDVYYVCQRCTNCCKWPGDVVLENGETEAIAKFLGMDLLEFTERYTRLRENRTGLSLIEKEGSHECIMLEGADCRIQAAKPKQCGGFPNTWKFPGWRKVCEAIPVPMSDLQEVQHQQRETHHSCYHANDDMNE